MARAVRGLVHEQKSDTYTDEWYTPAKLFDRIGMTFDVDPCSPGADRVPWVPAARHITKAEDGLVTPWGDGVAWLNPPYSGTERWVERLLGWQLEAPERRGAVVLTFARVGAGWARALMSAADRTLFLRQRMAFLREDWSVATSAGADSMLNVFGAEAVAAAERMAAAGHGLLMRRVVP